MTYSRDCDTSVAPEAMAHRPLWEDREGKGLRGAQERRRSFGQAAQNDRAGVQAGGWHAGNPLISTPEPSSSAEHPLLPLGGG